MSKLLQLTIALTILTSLTALTSPVLATINSDFDCPFRGGDEPEVKACLEAGVCDGTEPDCSGYSVNARAWCTEEQCRANANTLKGRCGICYNAPLRIVYLGNADGTPGECPTEVGFQDDAYNNCVLNAPTQNGNVPPLPAGRYYVYHVGCWENQEITVPDDCVLSGSLPCKNIGGPGLTCGTAPPSTTSTCQPKEWKCKNKNVSQPPVVCWSGIIASSRSCTPAGNPNAPCPTNQDNGQKDGTAMSKTSRVYNTFDYDSGKILSIPPVVLRTTTPFPTPTPTPIPTATPTLPPGLTPTVPPTPTITPILTISPSPLPTPTVFPSPTPLTTPTPTVLPNCPFPNLRIFVPNTTFKQSTIPNGCIKPVMIVIHWSGAWASANATYNGLEARGLSCQLATDQNMQLQMLQYFSGKVQKGYCIAGQNESGEYYNNMALNNEINGTSFDDIINNPAHERYNELIAETNRALESTCWMLKQYKIPKTQIFGHYELTPGKSDPGAAYLEYFIGRINNECH